MRIRSSWFFAAGMVLMVLVSSSAWEHRAPLVAAILFAAATILVAIASLGRMWCSLYIAGYKRKTLIKEGPYSMCRNPLYFFSFLGAVGVGLATETLTIPCIILVAFSLYYPSVIRKEERSLQSLHGEEYATYLASVPRFLPRLRQLFEPQTYVVNPIVFRQHIASALWFVWLIGAAEIVEACHHRHYLPVVMDIY